MTKLKGEPKGKRVTGDMPTYVGLCLIRHAIGRNDDGSERYPGKNYQRNYFCASVGSPDHEELVVLEQRGFVASRPVEGRLQYFHVLPKGRAIAEDRTAIGIRKAAKRVRRTGAKRSLKKPGPKASPTKPPRNSTSR